MKKKYSKLYQSGFISLVTIIVMMASLSMVVAMLYRSTQGNLLTSRLKQSNQAYQDGDAAAESVLMDIQRIDTSGAYDNGRIKSADKIPQNILAIDFCTILISCFDASGTKITNTSTKRLSDVTRIGTQKIAGPTVRALQVAVPQRVFIPSTVVSAKSIPRNIEISWDPIADSDTYDKIEVRRAVLTQTQYDTSDPMDLLSDTSLDWTMVGNNQLPKTVTKTIDTDVSSGILYAYTLKMTNKKALMLDSLYVLPRKIQML